MMIQAQHGPLNGQREENAGPERFSVCNANAPTQGSASNAGKPHDDKDGVMVIDDDAFQAIRAIIAAQEAITESDPIRDLLARSTDRVRQGIQCVHHTAQLLDRIVATADSMTQMIAAIHAGACGCGRGKGTGMSMESCHCDTAVLRERLDLLDRLIAPLETGMSMVGRADL